MTKKKKVSKKTETPVVLNYIVMDSDKVVLDPPKLVPADEIMDFLQEELVANQKDDDYLSDLFENRIFAMIEGKSQLVPITVILDFIPRISIEMSEEDDD